MKDHHRNDGKSFKDKDPIDSVTKTEANEPSCLSGGDSFITHQDFDNKSVRFGRTELLFFWNPIRETYKMGMVSGPVL